MLISFSSKRRSHSILQSSKWLTPTKHSGFRPVGDITFINTITNVDLDNHDGDILSNNSNKLSFTLQLFMSLYRPVTNAMVIEDDINPRNEDLISHVNRIWRISIRRRILFYSRDKTTIHDVETGVYRLCGTVILNHKALRKPIFSNLCGEVNLNLNTLRKPNLSKYQNRF